MRQSLFVLLIGIVLTGLAEARSLSDIEAVRTTISAWAKARESRNIDNYMAFYSPGFKSGELDFQRWREKKTTLFQSPGHVSLKITDLWVFVEGVGAEVRFIQHYESRYRSDVGEKKMFLARSNGNWKIFFEEWKPLINLALPIKETVNAAGSRYSVHEIGKTDEDVPGKVIDLSAKKLTVRRIEFQIEKERENVFIELNRFSIPAFFTLEGERPRIVIDIRNVSFWKGRYKVPVHGQHIKQIRSYYHRDSKKLRIVLDLKTGKDYMISQRYDMTGNIYTVSVTEAKNDLLSEPISKRPLWPNLCACPVECVAYSSGVRLKS